jgi:hypothetical protein
MSQARFQSNVFLLTGQGVPGELYNDYPRRAQSFTINSTTPADNIIGGSFFTVLSQGFAQAGNGSANLGAAGFLINPKVYALQGNTTFGVLSPSMTLPNFTQAEFLTEGSIYVTLPAAANIGDFVYYNNVTGALTSLPPATTPVTGTTFTGAFVDVYTVTGAGLAVITVDPSVLIPT